MRRLLTSRLIWIYTVCNFRLKSLFESVDMSKLKNGRVHFRNIGMKGLSINVIFVAMKIQISQPTRTLLETFGEYKTELRGEMEIKVKYIDTRGMVHYFENMVSSFCRTCVSVGYLGVQNFRLSACSCVLSSVYLRLP